MWATRISSTGFFRILKHSLQRINAWRNGFPCKIQQVRSTTISNINYTMVFPVRLGRQLKNENLILQFFVKSLYEATIDNLVP
ncbi:Uncharacterised protein [Brucella anthropi]|nr:hypothetical protein DR92_3209 [Brucella anthropi]SUB44137.1 Uncharacterised protein [Brucella anthropi]